jgi:uncharacterized protein YqiB (DUF1249 family)
MTLYESNFIRLGWLVPDPCRLPGHAVSSVPGDCPLELAVVDRARYTTTATLTYLFDESAGTVRDPALEIRVYHDARLVEATACGADHAGLARLRSQLPRSTDRRWSANMLLNKWLEYCADRGHGFATSPA